MSEWQETPTHWLASDGKWYPSQQPVSPAPPAPKRSWWSTKRRLIAGGVVAIVVIWGAAAGGTDELFEVETSARTEIAAELTAVPTRASELAVDVEPEPMVETALPAQTPLPSSPTTVVPLATPAPTTMRPTVVPAPTPSPSASVAAPLVSSPTVSPVGGGSSGVVAAALGFLAVADVRAELVAEIAYNRDSYAPGGWADSDGDCQSDRHEVLIDESLIPVTLTADGCKVVSGRWIDRLDGTSYGLASEVSIDHHVALSAAHRAGAWAWDDSSKQRFSSDIGFPAAHGVTGLSTNQAKADREPDSWKPPLQTAWCRYALDWVGVKTRWELAYSVAEVDALKDMLRTCDPGAVVGGRINVESANPVIAPIVKPTAVPDVVVNAGPADVVLGSCDARAEIVVLENRGSEPIRLSGWVLHDEGRKHEYDLSMISLLSGQRVSILTGPDATPTTETVVWKQQNVWNNDGDTAHLINSNQTLVDQANC